MEHYFRIALWMAILIGCLQAAPINVQELDIKSLKNEVQCDSNVTFSSPTNVQDHCNAAALKTIVEGLHHFRVKCQSTWRINQILEILDFKPQQVPQPTNSSDCKWDSAVFERFLNDTESFIQKLNGKTA